MNPDGLIVDSFAGGGGASLGIHMALNRSPDIAINHDAEAIAMHAANHPTTRHYLDDVWHVSPKKATRGQRVGLLWISPDCKDFSKAKGGKPVSKRVRGLAWVAVRWARETLPDVIIGENVEEFEDWGPLITVGVDAEGEPIQVRDPARLGLTFRRWRRELEKLGYVIELRQLVAADFGAPTIRKRLFFIARRDGLPIVWPTPTHAKPAARDLFSASLKPWRTAAGCIDWHEPVCSIFATKAEAKAWGELHGRGTPRRPLAETTMARIARGVLRFTIAEANPFVVPVTHGGDARVYDVGEPFRTVTGAHRGEWALVSPTLVQTGYGERAGQAPRSLDLHAPLGTVVGCGVKHALVTALLTRHNSGYVGTDLRTPAGTLVGRNQHSLTTTSLVQLKGSGPRGGRSVDVPLPTLTAGGFHFAEVRAFLTKFYGTSEHGQPLTAPAGTVTTRDRFGLVVVDGVVVVNVHGNTYAVADIGMRMLKPRELARAQGFPDSYRLDDFPGPDGETLTEEAQVRMLGNSVVPQLAEALIRANVPGLARAAA